LTVLPRTAAVFDGHAGSAAATYLEQHLYDVFSEMLDQNSMGLDCSLSEREEGLCCPLELHTVLTECYRRADEALLAWLSCKLPAASISLHLPAIKFEPSSNHAFIQAYFWLLRRPCAAQPEDEAGSGCTATTALVRSDRIIVANVGDSRAVLCRSGNAIDLSTEHRVYGRGPAVASETARVNAAGGWIDDGRVCGIIAVSRAFGDADFKGAGLHRMLTKGVEDGLWDHAFASSKSFTADAVISEPDVLEMATQSGDEFLVVATDGLWDVISSQEVCTLVRNDLKKGRHPKDVAQRLATVALRRYTADNVAVVVVDLKGEGGWRGEGDKKSKLFGIF